MMRTTDAPVPVLPAGPRPARPAYWKADLWVAIERLPTAAHHWDDFTTQWDEPGMKWDGQTDAGYSDATCDVQGLTIDVGDPDDTGAIDAAHLVATLANPSGEWSQFDAFGRMVAYEPGSRISVWATLATPAPWWLFDGLISAWRERADGTVEIEAYDRAAELNRSIGEWDPGTYGDTVTARMGKILDLVGSTAPRRLDAGQVTLHSYRSTATPLEELQSVAASDGGLFFADVDGTFSYRNRAWIGGRPDQTVVRKFSDNVCTVDNLVWDAELVTDDELLADLVELENVDALTVTAQAGAAPRRPYQRSGDQWIDQAAGQALAQYLVARRATSYVRVETFTLHLIDPRRNVWREAIDLRIGDLLRFLHDLPAAGGTARLDLTHVVARISHEITATAWTTTVGVSRAVGNNVTYQWDSGNRWDRAPAVWGF